MLLEKSVLGTWTAEQGQIMLCNSSALPPASNWALMAAWVIVFDDTAGATKICCHENPAVHPRRAEKSVRATRCKTETALYKLLLKLVRHGLDGEVPAIPQSGIEPGLRGRRSPAACRGNSASMQQSRRSC